MPYPCNKLHIGLFRIWAESGTFIRFARRHVSRYEAGGDTVV